MPPYRPPVVNDIPEETKLRLRREYVIDKERTVIVAPMTGSGLHLSPNFWINLIADLQRAGYIVYNNIGKNPAGGTDSPMPGAVPLNASLNEIFWLASQVRCVVAMRSGLTDLLTFSGGNLIVLYRRTWRSVELNSIFPNAPSRIRSLYFDLEFRPRLSMLMNEFDIESIGFSSMKYKFGDEIYWSEDDLRRTIPRELGQLPG